MRTFHWAVLAVAAGGVLAGCSGQSSKGPPARSTSRPPIAAPDADGEAPLAAAIQVDPQLPVYEKVGGEVSGAIKSVGSDTMYRLMELWSDGFKKLYPNVQREIEGKGSSTAPPALIQGTANFGPMSRDWKQSEIEDFERAFGYKPTAVPAAIDMLVVYVHKDNPIRALTMEQVDAIFSTTRKGGHDKDIVRWGDLGLTGQWANKPISLFGRNAASGTYQYFKEHALFGGDFKDTVKQQPGTSSVVQGVASDRYAIGYSGIGYKTADVVAISLSPPGSTEMVEPLPEHAYSGKYPLARFLYLSVNYRPGSALEPLRREFIRYVLSQQGQQNVVQDGYLPITAHVAQRGLAMVGLASDAAAGPAVSATSASKPSP
jgi:phosphate transport system substrate-binding protein